MNDLETRSKIIAMIREFRSAMLVTQTSGSDLHGRPMAIASVEDEGCVTFLTDIHSAKAQEIAQDQHVAITFQSDKMFISATGTASIGRDTQRASQLWSAVDAAWFDGPDDPRIGIVNVRLNTAEYWDNRGANMLSFIGDVVRGVVTGKRPEAGPEQHGVSPMR